MKKIRKAVILLSGGLDSAVSCAIAKSQGFEIYALSFFYGQRHEVELISAKKLANFFGAKEHKIAEIDLRIFGNSALTAEISVPKDRAELGFQDKNAPQSNIPITYVPARNTIFLAYSLAFAEVIGAFDIFIGVNSIDYSGYPDCRPEFIRSFEKMANLATAASTSLNSDLISDFDSGLKSDANAENSATKNELKSSGGKFKIHTPLGKLSKKEIIAKGIELGVDFGLTHSCYDPVFVDGKVLACGHCDSCLLRLEGFRALGRVDAIGYVEGF